MPGKIPLILFSGGLDSTFLLEKTLRNTDVDILYVSAVQGEPKIQEELEARKQIIKIIDDHPHVYYSNIRNRFEVKISSEIRTRDYFKIDPRVHGFNDRHIEKQLLPWLYGALQVFDPDIHNELLIGYVASDTVDPIISSIEKVWEQLIKILYNKKNIPIKFPLLYKNKVEIIHDIDPQLLKHTWWCEGPSEYYAEGWKLDNPCGLCIPCQNFQRAIIEIEILNPTLLEEKADGWLIAKKQTSIFGPDIPLDKP